MRVLSASLASTPTGMQHALTGHKVAHALLITIFNYFILMLAAKPSRYHTTKGQ